MRGSGLGRVCVVAVAGVALGMAGVAGSGRPAGAAVSSHLLRYPYLTDVTATAAEVSFATDAASPAAVVTFGPAGSGCATSQATATATAVTVGSRTEYQFRAQLSGLGANTAYCYRAAQNGIDLLGGDPSPVLTTALAPGDSTPYSFAVLGDWGAGTTDEANVLAQIARSPARFVVTVGDNVYNSGTQTEYGDLSAGNVFAPAYWKGVGATTPVFPAQGNHGFSQNLPYLQNFPESSVVQASAGRLQQDAYCCIPPMPGSKTYASAWYAFDWGAARYYVLEAAWSDSNGAYQGDFDAHWNGPVPGCPSCGTELQWLQSDLAAHASTPLKFAFFHYPLHADSSSQGSDTYLDGPSGLEGLLASNGVRVVFNGHAHLYERNRPQIAGSNMVSYVTGGGGDALGSVSGCSSFDAYAIGSSSSCNAPKPTSSSQVFHYLLVTVNGSSVTVTPTDENGNTFDVQTYSTGALSTTTIDSGPAPLTNATTATFAFHSTAAGATFTCALDAGTASPCASPTTLTGVAAGTHTFTVATTVPSGPAPAPVSYRWTVDTTAPSTPTGLTGSATSPSSVTLTWNPSTDNTGVAGYDIARNGVAIGAVGGTTTSFVDAAVSPATTYQYTVDARDGAGNVSPPSASVPVTTPAAAANDFALGASTSSLAVTAGQSATTTITTTVTSGSAQSVSLSASGLPAGAGASFSPATITTGQSSTMTITTSASTPAASSSVTVTAAGASATHSIGLVLAVNPSGGGSQPALVQTAGASETTAATSLTGAFAAPTGGGHLLVLSASVYTGITNPITSITDSASNTWTRIGAFAVSGHYSDGEMWYSANAAPVTSVTVHTASAAVVAFAVQEFSGIAASNALDVSTGASNTSTSPGSGTVTPAGTGDLVVGFVAGHGNAEAISLTSSGYSAAPQLASSNNGSSIATLVTASQVLASTGPQALTGSVASPMYWAAGIACFRAAG